MRLSLTALVLAAVSGSVVAVVSTSDPAQEPRLAPPILAAPDESTALMAARAQGTPVEVTGLKSETTQVFAQPNGALRMDQTVVPVRTRKDGAWTAIDPTLETTDSGIKPKVTVSGITFSAGGDQPLARMAKDGWEIELSWPTPLSAPTVSGQTATYAEVLPGVDLRLTANFAGFGHLLVVKTPEAAKNPELRRITYGLVSKGVTLSADKAGNLRGTDETGEQVFHAPAPTMWDSPRDGAPVDERQIGIELIDDQMVLTPDLELLASPSAQFPIMIDPQFTPHTADQNAWTLVRRSHPDQANYNLTPRDDDERYKGVARAGYAPGSYLDRSIFRFDTTTFKGATINWAEFKIYQTWKYSHSCKPTDVEVGAVGLYRTNSISASTTWNNQPTWHSAALDTARSVEKLGECPTGMVGFDARSAVQASASGNWNNITLGLRAVDESNHNGWRRFYVLQHDKVAQLSVSFNRKPGTPTSVVTEPHLTACALCQGVPYVTGDSINLAATIGDPDGGTLDAIWTINKPGASEQRQSLAAGSRYRTPLNLSAIPNGTTVTWSVRGWDGQLNGPTVAGPKFVVDRQRPATLPGVSSRLYPEDNAWHGGASVPGTFTFTPKSADDTGAASTDTIGYYYGFSAPPSTFLPSDALGGAKSVTLTPPSDGPVDLFVQSVDRAGNRSDTRTYHFYVRPGNGAKAQWSFDGNAEDTAHLGDRNGTLGGGAAFVQGALGSAVRLGNVSAHVEAPNTVRTDVAFSVSAWARLDSTNYARTIVQQDGTNLPGFTLSFTPDSNGGHWGFGIAKADLADAATDMATSAEAAQAGVWTHLTGVYDPTRPGGELTLYVNGVEAGTAARTTSAWHAPGKVRIGQTTPISDENLDWHSIDEVRIYDRVVTAAEVRSMVGRDNVQAAYWKFDEGLSPEGGRSNTGKNAVPGGHAMVRSTGTEFANTGAVEGSLELNGSDAYTSGPVVATDRSFSVATWLRLDQLAVEGQPAVAVTQDGTNFSGFFLGARTRTDDAVWELFTTSADTPERTGDAVVHSTESVQLGQWTHVAAVYDRQAQEIRLYVNGQLAGTSAAAAVSNVIGPLRLGRGRWNGVLGHAWHGGIDELRVYSRAISAAEIQGIVSQDGVPTAAWTMDGTEANTGKADLGSELHGAPMWTAGQTSTPNPDDLAVTLDGVDDHITATPAVDTSRSFGVAAWVKLTKRDSAWRTVVSQNGTNTSAFNLAYGGSYEDRWAFAMHGPDTNAPSSRVRVFSANPAQEGVWTHLAAVYDAPTGEMRLYVNGVLDGTATFTERWNATGSLNIGRAKWNGALIDQFAGSIDDVKVFSRGLFEEEVRQMAGRDLTLAHHWALDEPTGTPFAADSASGREATPDGSTFTAGRTGNGVVLDGVNDSLASDGSAIRTDQSFTVSAWVYLDQTFDKATAVSIDGARTSKFRLGLEIDGDENWEGNWIFEMPESDVDNPLVTDAAVAIRNEDFGTWVHLVGVYDQPTNKLWIFVNGTRISDGTLNKAWHSAGGVRIGAGKRQGEVADHWPGKVDDVRLYTGALDKDRVSALYRSYPATVGNVELPTADKAHWKFEEHGTTVADSSGNDHTMTKSGANHVTGGRVHGGMLYEETPGHAQTSGPVLDTTTSFSVGGWAYLSRAAGNRTLVGQDGERVSAFQLRYDGETQKWGVVAPVADRVVVSAADRVVLEAPTTAALHMWTHVGFTYDAERRQLRLYVNGLVVATTNYQVTLFPAIGPTTIGRGMWNGAPTTGMTYGAFDEIRLFGRVLSDAEMAAVHDDAYAAPVGTWRFDGNTLEDETYRLNHGTATAPGTSYADSVSGGGLVLDGVSGAMTTSWIGVPTRDSFTVSAWAKIARKDRVQTVVAQDGTRMSGFFLQYRPDLDRWVFGAPTVDADGAESTYASSRQEVTLNEWTHLVGVYDYAARQLRLYVNGQLSATRNGATLWSVTGGLTVGRGKVNGQPAHFFAGMVDEVRVEVGELSTEQVAIRGSWANAMPGQIGRYVNAAGDRYTSSTDGPAPAGYHLERVLGAEAPEGSANTRTLYACQYGQDVFTSLDPACEGQTVLGSAGRVFTQAPTNLPATPLLRCISPDDRFDSIAPDCEGATADGSFGYVVAYGSLARLYLDGSADHWVTAHGTYPSYRVEGRIGWLPLVPQPDTQKLLSCMDGTDQFVSVDPACEGNAVLGDIGYVWTQAQPNLATLPLYRCKINGSGQLFASSHEDCEGQEVDRLLGYMSGTGPIIEPQFS